MKEKVNIDEIIKKLTLKEKIGQLIQLAAFFFNPESVGEITGNLTEMGLEEEDVFRAGSVLGISGAKELKLIQSRYLEESNHDIPLVFMADIVHGYKTIFPVPLALGCSWNLEAAEKMAEISAIEASVGGVHITFSPMVDLVRDPRWGRVMESTGEDPYLNGLFAKAMVKGYQGDLKGPYNIGACVKHFAAYGAAEAGRDYNTVDMSERTLREYYLPAYKAAIDAGVMMVMTSFNTVLGVPATGNEYLMRGILRDEWGFEGTIISDWGAVNELIAHSIAEDGNEAALKAIKAGVDIEMMTPHYVHHLENLVKIGHVEERLIDDSVRRILELKEKLGLFENPYKSASEELETKLVLCDEHRNVARKIAGESIVLLENNGVLPINQNTKNIALIGPYGDEGDMIGPWHWSGRAEDSVTLLDGLKSYVGEGSIKYAKGCGIEDGNDDEFKKAIEVAKESDLIILALGEHEEMSGESGSRAYLKLPGRQEELIETILKLGKKVVVVLFSGRPLEISSFAKDVDALIQAWFPGTEGGNALADILMGVVNPSAKLTMSFPITVGQIPVYYNCYNTGRPKPFEENKERYFSQYLDIPNAPLYPFGYGLSYTNFEYSELELDKKEIVSGDTLELSVRITNAGDFEGREIVQLYIRDISGSVVRPLKELKSFKTIELKSGETETISFTIDEEMLKFHNFKNEFVYEKGKFEIMVGKNSMELLTTIFEFN
ncbi:MAG: beta-glucosidase BglX [Tissierellales bacterium]|jgi:beta-glucosidase|nr:beta-glucosidase BglX [Tissierellales bacterium]